MYNEIASVYHLVYPGWDRAIDGSGFGFCCFGLFGHGVRPFKWRSGTRNAGGWVALFTTYCWRARSLMHNMDFDSVASRVWAVRSTELAV